MKQNEYYIYGCRFPGNRFGKVYDYKSKSEIEIGTVATVQVRDYNTGRITLKEVTVVDSKGKKELTNSEISFYKEILACDLE